MGNTNIEWTDAVWNPVTGCTPVGPGCDNCYARRMAETRLRGRFGYPKHDPFRVTLHINRFEPLHWRKPRRVFVCSMGDPFHAQVPLPVIRSLVAVMALCPQHTFILLTKRPGRMCRFFGLRRGQDVWNRACVLSCSWPPAKRTKPPPDGERWPLPNVWLGTSVENQCCADKRRKPLHELAERGWPTFVSYESALGPVDWRGWGFLDWLIAGGESGPGARPAHPDWFRNTRNWCVCQRIPFFFKQWGAWAPACDVDICDTRHDYRYIQLSGGDATARPLRDHLMGCALMFRVGKKNAGRLLDGREWNQLPEPRTPNPEPTPGTDAPAQHPT